MEISRYNEEIQNYIIQIQNNRGQDSTTLIELCDKLEDYGRRNDDDALIGFACFSRGETYYLLNDMKNFYTQMIACLEPMEKLGEWGYVTMANNMLGIMSLNRGNAPFAMDYYLKAIGYCQKYKLPDLEWIVHMNVASLYYNIGEYKKSLDQLEIGYHYIISHPEMPDYYNNLITVYMGMSKNYLRLDKLDVASSYLHRIDCECTHQVDDINKLLISCLRARLYFVRKMDSQADRVIEEISEGLTLDMPIMDMFDDLYDYLQMLLVRGMRQDFLVAYKIVEKVTERTNIKNLKKNLLTLKVKYYKQVRDVEKYQEAAIEFFDVSELMERENRMMVINMIGMRSSLNNLVQLNKEVEQENELLQRKSETDPLTGLYNRSKLNEYGEEAFERAYHQKTPMAIEILDVDYFKQYNDNYGHQQGDKAIQLVADIMMQVRRKNKKGNIFCSRYGGDEFVIIYEGLSKDETMAAATQLKQMILAERLEHKYSFAADILTISQGICWGIPNDETRVWDYLHIADELLYNVKKVSRNSIKIAAIGDIKQQ
ncbi:MAG: GGDEF domain-containing protein [Lachnospiraceae bacterium]|nr:GGDEF domain-containing protein [Lachnospiraceae bacterium]